MEEQREIEEEDAAAAQELFCVCQQPDNPEAPRDFVQCDKCQQWFHPECVSTTTQVRLPALCTLQLIHPWASTQSQVTQDEVMRCRLARPSPSCGLWKGQGDTPALRGLLDIHKHGQWQPAHCTLRNTPGCVQKTWLPTLAPLQAVHDMEEWACPLCTRRRGGLRTAALRSAPAKFDPEAAPNERSPQEEGPVDLPRSARSRHADADAAPPATGLKLRLPASTEVSMRNVSHLRGALTGENALWLG